MNIPNYDDDGPIAEPARPYRITTQEPLTKRERFAMAAMQGLCANREWGGWDFAHVAQMARKQADHLITELNSTPEPE